MLQTSHIGARLKELRERVGMSQRALSLKIGKSESYIKNIEAGKSKDPGFAMVIQAVDAMGFTYADLIEGVEPSSMPAMLRKNEWIADRLSEVGRTKTDLARAIGVEPPRITDLLKGSREIKASDLQPMATVLDMSLDDVYSMVTRNDARPSGPILGNAKILRRAADNDDHTQPAVISTLGDDYAALPRWKIAGGAGAGNVIVPEPDAPYRLLFREEWLRRITPAPLNDLVVLDVAGTSMEPTLMHGDLALIDRTQTERHDDAIYVVLDGNEVKVKRVLIDHATGGLILRSDNPMVKDLPPAPAEVRQIVGKVIWIGRQM